jgi:AraC-like DNA-binding protein
MGFPQTSISSNMILHPVSDIGIIFCDIYVNSSINLQFIRPMTVIISDAEKAIVKEKGLVTKFNFIDDGFILVDPRDALDAFGVVLTKSTTRRYSEERTQQYVHVSGLLFVRIFHDESGWTLFAFMGNRRLIGMNEELKTAKMQLFELVSSYLKTD